MTILEAMVSIFLKLWQWYYEVFFEDSRGDDTKVNFVISMDLFKEK